MTRNTRGDTPKKTIDIDLSKAKSLVDAYTRESRSCKVMKLGLHKVVDALVAQGGRSPLIHKILTDPNGPFKADMSPAPVLNHINKVCACYRDQAPKKGADNDRKR